MNKRKGIGFIYPGGNFIFARTHAHLSLTDDPMHLR
jgi:hypothetical protein